MVNLVLSPVVWRNPSRLVDLFVWENTSSDNKLVKGTNVSKQLSVVTHFTKTMLPHDCLKACIVASHLSIEISKEQYQVLPGYSIYNPLHPLIELRLYFVLRIVGWGIALDKGGFANLSVEPSCDNPG